MRIFFLSGSVVKPGLDFDTINIKTIVQTVKGTISPNNYLPKKGKIEGLSQKMYSSSTLRDEKN